MPNILLTRPLDCEDLLLFYSHITVKACKGFGLLLYDFFMKKKDERLKNREINCSLLWKL